MRAYIALYFGDALVMAWQHTQHSLILVCQNTCLLFQMYHAAIVHNTEHTNAGRRLDAD